MARKHPFFRWIGLGITLLLATANATAQSEQGSRSETQAQQEKQEPEEPFGLGADAQEQSPQPAGPTLEERRAIEELLQEPNVQKRLQLALAFLDNYPESQYRGRAYATAAEAYRMQNDYREAIESGERALELAPRDAVTMIVVADSLVESARRTRNDYQERLARAEDYATRALELLPEIFAGMVRRPEVPEEEYQRQQHYIEAQARAALGFVYLRQEAYEQAEQQLKQAVELSGERPNRHDFLRLGFAHVRQREWQEARDVFRQCVERVGEEAGNCQQQLDRMENILERKAAAQAPGSQE